MKFTQNRKGVTLIELLIYIFISGLVISSIFYALTNSNQIFISQTGGIRSVETAREAVSYLSHTIKKTGWKNFVKPLGDSKYEYPFVPVASFNNDKNYADPNDQSSFYFIEQGTNGNNAYSDALTIRYLMIDGETGSAMTLNGDDLDTTTIVEKAIVVEEEYKLGKNEHENDLMVRRKYITGDGDVVRDYGDQILVRNIVAFQTEFGLLGVKHPVFNDSIYNVLGSSIYSYTNSSNDGPASDKYITITPERDDDGSYSGETSYSVDIKMFKDDNGKRIRTGAQYSISFTIKTDQAGIAQDWKDDGLVVSVVSADEDFNEEVAKISSIGEHVLTYSVSDAADKANDVKLNDEGFIENASLRFSFKTDDTAKIELKDINVVKQSKGDITWVGGANKEEIWQESEFISAYGASNQSDWIENKKNVRAIRVSVLAKSPSAKKGVGNAKKTYDNIGNMDPYVPYTDKEGKHFSYRTYRVVIPVTQNGKFMTKKGIDENDNSSWTPDGSTGGGSSSGSPDNDLDDDGIHDDKDTDKDGNGELDDKTDEDAKYDLVLSVEGVDNPEDACIGGTSAGEYEVGTPIGLTAEYNENKVEFLHWIGGPYSGWEAESYGFEINGYSHIIAVFKEKSIVTAHVVKDASDTDASDTDVGEVAIDGDDWNNKSVEYGYSDGVTATVRAKACGDYVFLGWSTSEKGGNFISTDKDYEFTVDGTIDLYANFAFGYWIVNKTKANRASISVNINNSGVSSLPYGDSIGVTPDSKVRVELKPSSGFEFKEWLNTTSTLEPTSENKPYEFETTIESDLELEAWLAGKIAHWDMSDKIKDLTSEGNDAILTTKNSSPEQITENSNTYLNFDYLEKDFLSVGDGLEIEEKEMTVSAWVNATSFLQSSRVISKGDGTNRPDWGLVVLGEDGTEGENDYSYGKLQFRIGDNNTSISSDNKLLLETWYHVVGVYDGTNIKTYIDGVETGSISSKEYVDNSKDALTYIGNKYNNTQEPTKSWSGFIDEVSVYNYALTKDEIENLYEQNKTAFPNDILKEDYFPENPLYNNKLTSIPKSVASNGVTVVEYNGNKVLEFNGNNGSFLSAGNSPKKYTFDEPTATFSVWAKIAKDDPFGSFIVRPAYDFYNNNDDDFDFGYKKTNDGMKYIFEIKGVGYVECTLSSNQYDWHFVTAVQNGTTLSLYIDGTLQKTEPVDAKNIPHDNQLLYIGGIPDGSGRFQGLMSHVVIGSFAWSEEEIKKYYDDKKALFSIN